MVGHAAPKIGALFKPESLSAKEEPMKSAPNEPSELHLKGRRVSNHLLSTDAKSGSKPLRANPLHALPAQRSELIVHKG